MDSNFVVFLSNFAVFCQILWFFLSNFVVLCYKKKKGLEYAQIWPLHGI